MTGRVAPLLLMLAAASARTPARTLLRARIETSHGTMLADLYPDRAPQTVENFVRLSTTGFYDGLLFHRVVPGFVIQAGDPLTRDEKARDRWGTGGPGYTLPAEIDLKHERGSLAMARLPDSVNPQRRSSGSQFYICLKDLPFLDGQYTVFGRVIKGMEVAEAIEKVERDRSDRPLKDVRIKKIQILALRGGKWREKWR